MLSEGRLDDVKKSIERILATDDGQVMMEFLEIVTGVKRPLVVDNLDKAEGARRVTLLIQAINDCPQKQYKSFCKQEGDRWFK